MSDSRDVEQWKRELNAAGWTALRHDLWKAPCGCLYLGPWRAWTVMLAIRANELECPNHITGGILPP